MFVSLAVAMSLQAQTPAPMPTGEALEQAIADVDGRLFWAAFEGCDAQQLAPLLDDNFRMVHDLAGLSVPSRDSFVEGMAAQCAERAETGYKNRRLLTPGSRRVQALGEWGALEEGHHQFYEWREDRWVLTGGARYIHTWRWNGDAFVLDNSISVDHGPAATYPPEENE